MCDQENSSALPLSFDQFVDFLREPPFEPCGSELQFLSPVEYERAFMEAMRLYYPRVRGHIAHIVKNRDMAADLAQEVFINLYRARASFDGPYIYRAAKNTAFSALIRNRRRLDLESRWAGVEMRYARKGLHEFEAADTRPPQDVELFVRARVEAAKNAVDRLPEKFREPLVLLAAGRSYREITEMMGVNEGTVKSRICRGKSLLRRRLRAYL
jgi:RNA polymerase sigma-70 factor (ECF subfamily)